MNDSADSADAVVSYSVRDLFEKVDAKLDRIVEQLEGKADKAQVDALEGKVDALEQFRWKVVGIALGAGLSGSGALVAVLKALGSL